MKKIIQILLFTLLFTSCVGDSYYDKLNTPPTISISNPADTIKVSPATFTNQVSEIVTCYDYNMNMRILSFTSSDSTNILLFDDKNTAITTIPIGNNVEKLNQKVVFQAKKEGDYTINFKIADAWTTYSSVSYKIHAFTNLLPVAVLDACTLIGSTLTIDMSSSYDADKKYGGAVKSYLVYIDGEETMEFISPKMSIILSENQIMNIATTLMVAVRDNDSELSPKIKPTIQ